MTPLPHIPRKHLKRDGKVELWDIVIEGGPVKLEFTAILAREALQRDPERYKLDLPRGVKQGQLQDDADERAVADAAEEANTQAADPHYGRKGQA